MEWTGKRVKTSSHCEVEDKTKLLEDDFESVTQIGASESVMLSCEFEFTEDDLLSLSNDDLTQPLKPTSSTLWMWTLASYLFKRDLIKRPIQKKGWSMSSWMLKQALKHNASKNNDKYCRLH
jgi:hypothetical protein